MRNETDVTVRDERGVRESADGSRLPRTGPAEERTTHMDTHTGSTVTVEHLRWRRISWRAILGGAAVALALQTPLVLLGLGIGLINADAIGQVADIALVTWIWWMVAGVIALFFGAWVAGHLVAPATPLDGAMNGFVVWAVLTLVMLWMATAAATSVIGGAWSTVTGASRALVEGGSTSTEVMVRQQSGRQSPQRQGQPVVELSQPGGAGQGGGVQVDVNWSAIGRDVEQFLAQQGVDARGLNLEQQFEDFGDQPIQNTEELYSNLKGWLTDSSPGARQRIERYLADNTDLTEQEIEQRLDRWERQAREARREVGAAVEQGADAVGKAALWTAAGSLVGLLAAGAGGAVGAASASPRRRKDR
jgi:hypothetical protein